MKEKEVTKKALVERIAAMSELLTHLERRLVKAEDFIRLQANELAVKHSYKRARSASHLCSTALEREAIKWLHP
jgi:hypothetical protein